MRKLGVCIETFFPKLPYQERIKKIKDIGFKYYEFWFHNKLFDGRSLFDDKKDFNMLADINAEYGLTTTDFVFNHPDGGVVASLIDKEDRIKLTDSIEEMIGYAKKIGCKNLITGSGNKIDKISHEEAVENMVESLRAVTPVCERNDITLILEPFNTKVDHPDYFLDDPVVAAEVLRMVNSPNVKMLFDIYHMQIMAGNILTFIKENLALIGHFHIAGVPGRGEPVFNELNYEFIVAAIEDMGYDGAFGLEYFPHKDDEVSLIETFNYFMRE